MNEDLKHKIYNPGDCISEKMMFDYIDHKLSPKERHTVEKHMLDCELCSDAMEGLEQVKDRERIMAIRNEADAVLAGKKDARIITFNFKTVFSIAATVALLVVGVFFFSKSHDSMKEDNMADLLPKEQAPPPAKNPTATEEETPAAEAETTGKKNSVPGNAGPVNTEQQAGTTRTASDYKNTSQPDANTQQNVAAGAGVTADQEISLDDSKNEAANNVSATPAPEASASKPLVLANSKSSANEKVADETFKKTEEKKIDQTTVNYSATTPQAPGQSGENETALKRDKAAKNAESAKDADSKGGKYRAEGKSKEQKDKRKTPRKNASNENQAAATGTVAYEPESVREDKQKVLEEKEQSEEVTKEAGLSTIMADSISTGETVYTIVDEMPKYPGGDAAMVKYLNDNIHYPATDNDGTVIGSCVIEFIVKTNGRAVNAKVIKPKSAEFEKQVVAAISQMPLWKPGKKDGNPVAVRIVTPVKFNAK